MKYTITYEKRGIGLESKTMNGETLDQCLKIFLQECMNTDDTGIFFELENVDVVSQKLTLGKCWWHLPLKGYVIWLSVMTGSRCWTS